MSETTLRTHLAILEQKSRKRLNSGQIAVLVMLYNFRFVSSDQVAQYSGKKDRKSVQKRLKILEEQELIAKRYGKSYKLKGKPAAYYLTPKGARTLTELGECDPSAPINMKLIYKEKTVSESFIDHCLNILTTFLALRRQYWVSNEFQYYPKNRFQSEEFDHFPRPLPDAYFRLGQRTYFLHLFEDSEPFFVAIRRIKQYLTYAESDEWHDGSESELPTILFVVTSTSTQKRLRKAILSQLRSSYEEISFATALLSELRNPDLNDRVWRLIDESEDPQDPDPPRRLYDLHAEQ